MSIVFFLNGVQGIRIRVGKVQVVAQHGNVDAVFLKQMPQIQRIAGGQGAGGAGQLLEGFAQSHMGAGKAFLAHQRQHLFNGQLFRVMQTQAELDHGKPPPFPHNTRGCIDFIIHESCVPWNSLKQKRASLCTLTGYK